MTMYSEMATAGLMLLTAILAYSGGWALWGKYLRDAKHDALSCADYAHKVEREASKLQALVTDCPRCSRRLRNKPTTAT